MSNISVHIESVKLDNFLSFYSGKVTFNRGLTVLAGPNGSGKTSIFHALKFALGSNQRENRYTKWSDFIRHGAQVSQVEVVVNANGRMRRFQRKIDRDGIPRAYVDSKRVKAAELKQIVQTFGLDTDNPLIFIPQERINAVRDMDPHEVRILIEEGTGLDVLRDRISLQETEVLQSSQKLETTLTESKSVEREIELLQHDLERLEKKRSLLEQERKLEHELRWSSLDDTTEKIDIIKADIEGKEGGLISILDEQTHIQSAIADNEIEIDKTESSISSIQKEHGRIDAKIEEEEHNLARLEGDSQKQIGEMKHLEKEIKIDSNNKEKLKEDFDRIISTKEETMEKQREYRQSLQQIEDERSQISGQLEAFAEWNTKRAEAYGKYKALQAEVEGKDLLSRSVRERLQIEEAELQSIESKWSNMWAIMEKSDEKELARRKGQLEREIASVNEERFRQSSLVSQLQKEIDELNIKLSETSKRIPDSVKQLKDAVAEHKLESVTGPLMELFTGDDTIASAVEAVMNNAMLLAFVVTEESDFQILQKLRDRLEAPSPIIFLRISEDMDEQPTLKSDSSVEGWLWDRLNTDEKTKILFRRAVGDFVLTKNIRSATRQAIKDQQNAVTLDGNVISANKERIISLPKNEPSGIVSTAPLQSRLGIAVRDLRIAKKKVTDTIANLDNITSQREEVLDLLSQMTRWSGTWDRRKKLLESIPEQEERINALEEEIKSLRLEISKSEKTLRSLDNTQPAERSRLVGQDSALRIKHRQLQTELTKIDARASAAERDEGIKRQEIKRLNESIMILENRLEELRTELLDSRNVVSEILKRIEAMKVSREETQKQHKALADDLNALRDTGRSLSGRIIELNLIIKEKKLQVLQSKRQLTNLEYDLENLERELEGTARPKAVRPLEQVRNELIKLRHILDDYQDVSESVAHTENQLKGRLSVLVQRVAEIQEELDEAESAVKNIREQYHNGMNETLTNVEKNVNEVLGSVQFPGSVRFELNLRDGSYGVEFKSRIKAEGFGEISAGSGGERSLIAISLILALQRFNPAPVYVLDEVDTFLDATNTELVSRLFHDASRRSQFILLTPAKSTHLLKHADKIVGVVAPNGVEPSVIIESPSFKGQGEVIEIG